MQVPGRSVRFRRFSLRGFSLTELLVVIAVITILLAILFTVVHAAIKAVRALKG
jgi:prepilin-type N-terminal cleavage/methylation domain-containing protein